MRDLELTKDINNRLRTAVGHLTAIENMVDNGESCEKILMQLSAVESAINKTGKIILKNHLNTCVKEGLSTGKDNVLEEFNKILEKYLKY